MESVDPKTRVMSAVSKSPALPRWASTLRAQAGALLRWHFPGGVYLGKGSMCRLLGTPT